MSMMIRFKFKGRCEKHPRYNPAREGIGAVKAGCDTCQQLYRIWAFVEHAASVAMYFDGTRVRYHTDETRVIREENRN